ncbi:MAG: hypothetical protein IKN43_10155 [Selenomonadaceae bacterium]|nr:hypothetical protein [Selenomonadaceae bacterium]
MIETLNDKPFTEKEIVAFNEQYLEQFKNLATVVKKRKAYEDEEKKAKAALQKVMDEYEIKSVDNEYIKITRVAPAADKITVDLEKFKENEPKEYEELLKDYPKTVKGKAGYLTFKVK